MFHASVYRFFQLLLRLMFRLVFRLRIEGARNFPHIGGFIIASNHPSLLDPPLVAAVCPRRVRIVAKSYLFRIPIVRIFLWGAGCYPVEEDPVTSRSSATMSTLRAMIRTLQQGEGLLIFPEGGVSDHARVRPFEPGLAVLARKATVPIIPVVIIGTYDAWPQGQRIPRPRAVVVRVGRPFEAGEIKRFADPAELAEAVRARIIAMNAGTP